MFKNENGFEYEKNVSHCDKSNYVSVVTATEFIPIEGADKIEVMKFAEKAWQVVVPKGGYKVGDKLTLIPPEAVLPMELSEKLGITRYLSKGRVKIARMRGALSQGVVADPTIVEPYLDGIMQWEDEPSVGMSGEMLPRAETPLEFSKFYKMPLIMNEPDTFRIGEEIYISEKIHGSNARASILKHPFTEEYQMYIGTHETIRRETESDMYWYVIKETLKKNNVELPKDLIFFGELWGYKIQHLGYGKSERLFTCFAILDLRGQYLNPAEVTRICNEINLPCVKFTRMVFNGVDELLKIADGPSEYWDGIKEGIVCVSAEDANRMAKVIGMKYLESKGRKEGH